MPKTKGTTNTNPNFFGNLFNRVNSQPNPIPTQKQTGYNMCDTMDKVGSGLKYMSYLPTPNKTLFNTLGTSLRSKANTGKGVINHSEGNNLDAFSNGLTTVGGLMSLVPIPQVRIPGMVLSGAGSLIQNRELIKEHGPTFVNGAVNGFTQTPPGGDFALD